MLHTFLLLVLLFKFGLVRLSLLLVIFNLFLGLVMQHQLRAMTVAVLLLAIIITLFAIIIMLLAVLLVILSSNYGW